MNMKRILLLLLIIPLSACTGAFGQDKADSIPPVKKEEKPATLTPYHRNVIKFNPTPMLLFSEVRNITLSYERMINNTMSLSLQAGYLLLPKLIGDTLAPAGIPVAVLTNRSKYGVNMAIDYRYYPFSRNRRPAPDGLYIGGYASYYGFRFQNNFDILQTNVDQKGAFKGQLNVVNVGMSLGYQFIFWKRFSLDMLLFGPSFSYYQGKLNVAGELDQEEIEGIDQEVVDKILNRFPMLKSIFSKDGLTFTGNRTTTSIGFRYSIQLGFHF